MSSEPKLNGYKVCELVPHTERGRNYRLRNKVFLVSGI